MPAGSAVHAVGLHVVARSLAEGAIQRARAAAVAIARATRGRRARAAGARNGAAGHDVASAHGGAGGAAILAPGRSAGLAQRDARAATKALSGRAHAEPRGAHLSTGARALAGAAVPCVGLELGARPAAESVPFGAAGRRVEPAIHPGVGSFRHRRTGHVDLHTRRTDSATEGRPENHYTPSTHTHPFRIYNNREIAARAASWSPSAAPRAWPLRGGRLRPGPSSNRARTTVADDRGPGARRCRTHTVPPPIGDGDRAASPNPSTRSDFPPGVSTLPKRFQFQPRCPTFRGWSDRAPERIRTLRVQAFRCRARLVRDRWCGRCLGAVRRAARAPRVRSRQRRRALSRCVASA